jgi:type I restriction enzyme S subunit
LRTPEYREYCRARATGTTNLGLSREDFLKYDIILPAKKIQHAFESFESLLDAIITSNRTQSRTLAALREMLLPKLLTGELRTNGAEN